MEQQNQEDLTFNILNLYALSLYDDPKPDASGKKPFPNPMRVSVMGTKVKFTYKDPGAGFVEKSEYSNNYAKYQVKSEFFINQIIPFLQGVADRIKLDDKDFSATLTNMVIEGVINILKISRVNGVMHLHPYVEGAEGQPYELKLPDCSIEGLDEINQNYKQLALVLGLKDIITSAYAQVESLNHVKFTVPKQQYST